MNPTDNSKQQAPYLLEFLSKYPKTSIDLDKENLILKELTEDEISTHFFKVVEEVTNSSTLKEKYDILIRIAEMNSPLNSVQIDAIQSIASYWQIKVDSLLYSDYNTIKEETTIEINK